LERRGVRTVTICTDVFQPMADLERSALGMPDLALAITEHPLVSRTQGELEHIADRLLPLFDARFGREDQGRQ
jgi:hypothetical protein